MKNRRYLLLLLYWPFFLITFFLVERIAYNNGYTVIHCVLDDRIPFCEYFIIPYVIWYPFWVLMLLYALIREVPVFIRFSKYLMITLTISLIIYIVWPTGQDMWPAEFPRNNFFTWLTGLIYKADTNTNVCPSEHVSTAFGTVFAAMSSKRFSGRKWMIFFWAEAILVALSVAFIKQHSVLDVAAAVPIILIGYFTAFHKKRGTP
ncbi:MAG: phosphatidic acid phosphatase [Lachnospiraceae bacterium]|nr:phosphatidic acid phosphatase [Lachnospiraceae bacterium]